MGGCASDHNVESTTIGFRSFEQDLSVEYIGIKASMNKLNFYYLCVIQLTLLLQGNTPESTGLGPCVSYCNVASQPQQYKILKQARS